MADDDLEISTFVDGEGNKEVRVGDTVVEGGLSGRGRMERDRINAAEAADTPQDVEEYENILYNDPDYAVVHEALREAAPHADPADAERINKSYRAYVAEYKAMKNVLVAQELNAPRLRQVEQLKTALAEERERNGGRESTRSQQILERLSSLHGGGR